MLNCEINIWNIIYVSMFLIGQAKNFSAFAYNAHEHLNRHFNKNMKMNIWNIIYVSLL